jgi:hypothetical protein
MRWLLGSAAAVVVSVALAAGVATAASPNASVSETINVAVRTLTVSPSFVSLCSAANPLTFPDRICLSQTVTITNGGAGGHVDITGANAIPSDGGNGWRLCGGAPTAACTGPNGLPGQDEYGVATQTTAPVNIGPASVTGAPGCDVEFDELADFILGCASAPGQTSAEQLVLQGPSSSTDQSPTFTTSVTWTAVP